MLAATAAQLAARPQDAGSVVVVHGAGSFGHFQAKEYGLSRGAAQPSFSWLGFALCRSSVTRLT